MASRSPRVPRSATRIYGGIVLAVTTITVGVFIFHKLWGTGNKTEDEGNSEPGRDPDASQPSIDQDTRDDLDVSTPVQSTTSLPDHSAGDESQLVPSHAPPAPTTSEPQSINQDTTDKPSPTLTQPSITPRPQLIEHTVRDEGLGISAPSQPNTSEPQLINQDAIDEHDLNTSILADHSVGDEGHLEISVPPQGTQFIDQYARDTEISILVQASTTLRPYGDIRKEELPSMTLSQGSSNFQISETNASIIRSGDGPFTKIQRNLACEYIANPDVALPDTNDDLKKHALVQTKSIKALRAAAVLNNYQNNKSGPCFNGTRVTLLREMADCVTGSSESRMYILSGPAATGKSTVAYTIASRAADLDLLGASFVFSRHEANHNDVEKLFITIAYQLCVYNETFYKAIGDMLETEEEEGEAREYPQDQLQCLIQQLILDPLRSIVQSRSRPTLIVVDALDECNEKDAFSVLTGLSQLVRALPLFKVILTTRPGPYLDRFLSSQDGHTFLHLQDIENKDVNGDIRLYLAHNLSMKQVQKHYPKCQWRASDEEMDFLVRGAGKFFIASMAVRYILDNPVSNPAAQMQKLVRAYAQDYIPFKDLDRFYTVILRDVVPEDCDDNIVSRYQSVVGTIISVQYPLPVSALAHLIGIDVEEIRAVLDKLQSVILLGDDDVPRMCHKSFPEYLTDQSRCRDLHLRIDPGARTRHTQIAKRCFDIMNKHLKRNILGLGDLARFMNNEDGVKEDGITDGQLKEKIPHQLRYACVYWVNHLEVGNIEDTALMNGLEKFADDHMLHWLEVLSLIGKFDSALPAINIVVRLLRQLTFTRNMNQKEVTQKLSSDLDRLLSNALRFIGHFGEIIERSALHTYYSALPFTPTDSPLYRQYNKEAVDKICIIEGGLKKWDPFVAERWHENETHIQVRFSLDSALLVSYSNKHKQGKLLKIWDAATGEPISMIPGDQFAVANNCSTFASSRDNIATLYNVNGSPSSTTFTASSKIQELALSSESSRIAAALADGTVWLWESKCATSIDSFDGFEIDDTDTGKITMRRPWLQFSPTGTRLVYSSANSIVKLRDGISGTFIADLQCGSSDHRYFEFSGDGSRITSLSKDRGLTLWDSETGGLIGDVRDVNQYSYGLAISADGSFLATADFDNVMLWTANCNHLAQIKVLKVSQSQSIAFSLDNILAIPTPYCNIAFYDVNSHCFISTLSSNGWPTALVFSPDCTRLAAGGHDGTVRLWEICSIPPSEEKRSPITALTLSRDCSRLACGFGDGTVELWDLSPTKRRIAFHKAHKRGNGTLVEFGPDGELFASGPSGTIKPRIKPNVTNDETIKLWNGGDGSLRGTLKASAGLGSVALSNSVLVAAGSGGVTLWSLDTLSLIHTFTESSYENPTVSIAENNALIAVAHSRGVSLLDAVKHRIITTVDVDEEIHTMTFLPDNLQLVVQSKDGVFLSINLINKHARKGPTLEHIIQLPNIPLWHGVPVWYHRDEEHQYLAALFPQQKSPLPVLWIPKNIHVTAWTQGSSMIALHCKDERIILLRLPTCCTK